MIHQSMTLSPFYKRLMIGCHNFSSRTAVWVMVLLFTLSGCSDQPTQQKMFENYLWRLSNVLEQEYQSPMAPVIALPAKRELALPIKEFTIDLLDFLAITGCRLQYVAGYKNSGLGRVMVASQRLLYEYRFIQEAPACIASLRAASNLELAKQLADILTYKQSQLSLYQWNAFWTAQEVRHYYGVSKQWLSNDQALVLPQSQFETLLRMLQARPEDIEDVESMADDFENALGVLQFSNVAGEALTTYQSVIEYLKQGTRMLNTENALKLCRLKPEGDLYVSEQAKILHTVFLKFYIGEIQRYISFLDRDGIRYWQQQKQLLQATRDDLSMAGDTQFMQTFDGFAARYIDYQSDQSIWSQFHIEVKHHTEAWQTVLSRCGLMPKAADA